MQPDLATLRRGFAQTWSDVTAVCTGLTQEQWLTPTELPGWTVQDNLSHIVAEESHLLGDPAPVHELPAGLAYLRSDFAREIEVPIDFRRGRPGDEVLHELESVAARRLRVLDAYDDAALDEQIPFAGRTMPLRNALGIRLFDCWTHEQDIRHAVGRPGGFDNVAAELAINRLLRSLPGLAEDVPAAAGRCMVIETTGVLPTVSTLRFAPEASYVDGDSPDADIRLTTDVDTFRRLATGRIAYDQVASEVALTGDTALGADLVRNFAVTP